MKLGDGIGGATRHYLGDADLGTRSNGRGEKTKGVNNRRSNIEVIADILRLGEAGKTEIMYSANMSYRQLQRYLDFLTQGGLIERVKLSNPVVTYKVTRKGSKLLRNIDDLLEMLT